MKQFHSIPFVRLLFVLAVAIPLLILPSAVSAQDSLGLGQDKRQIPSPYPEFSAKLSDALQKHGMDAQHQTFHFVILMNTVHTQGQEAQGMRNIYYGLLNDFCVSAPDTHDVVSFAPYQLNIREEGAAWNRDYSPAVANDLYKLVPTMAENVPGTVGGHDDEAALLEAIHHVKDPSSAIFILLSDSEVSQVPDEPRGYQLTNSKPEFVATLQEYHIQEIIRGQFTGEFPNTEGTKLRPVTMYYQIYLADGLKPLGTILKSRSDYNSETKSPSRPEKPAVVTPTAATDNNLKRMATTDDSGLLVLVPIAVVLVAGIVYFFWLKKPRGIQIGAITGRVQHGKRQYVGGERGGQNVLCIPGVDTDAKFASLNVSLNGSVIMRGEGKYTVGRNGKVELGPSLKRVPVKDNAANRVICQLDVRKLP